jgi:hypothetical protein
MELALKILKQALTEIHDFTTKSDTPKTREEAIAYLHLVAIGSEVALREAEEAIETYGPKTSREANCSGSRH